MGPQTRLNPGDGQTERPAEQGPVQASGRGSRVGGQLTEATEPRLSGSPLPESPPADLIVPGGSARADLAAQRARHP
jgi:hypothetical protein